MWNYIPPDYVPVSSRIDELHKKYPNNCIETSEDIIWEDTVRFKAKITIYKDNWVFTYTWSSFIKLWKDKAYEKWETVAVGRALAFAWFETRDWIASREEMENFEDNKNNPPEEVKWFNFRDLKKCVEGWIDTDVLLRNHIKDNWYKLSRKITETIQNYLKSWELVEVK